MKTQGIDGVLCTIRTETSWGDIEYSKVNNLYCKVSLLLLRFQLSCIACLSFVKKTSSMHMNVAQPIQGPESLHDTFFPELALPILINHLQHFER